ncbi:MAG: DUF4920 domain-containing protein [Lishizhenia sp.]
MKSTIIALSAVALLFSCGESVPTEEVNDLQAEETVKVEEAKTEFGPTAVDTEAAMSTAELLAQFNGKEELEATFQGEITEVCAKMGCWISVKNPIEGEEDFMVRFKDHFTIPVDTELGSMAYLHGTAIQDTVSVDFQRHLLEDGGMSAEDAEKAVSEEKITMTFIADGIKLAESK